MTTYIDAGGRVRNTDERRDRPGFVLLMARRLAIGESFSYVGRDSTMRVVAHNLKPRRFKIERSVKSYGDIILVTRLS